MVSKVVRFKHNAVYQSGKFLNYIYIISITNLQTENYFTIYKCAAALARIGIGRVFFGCRNSRFGGNGSLLDLHNSDAIQSNSHVGYDIFPGILEEDAINLLRWSVFLIFVCYLKISQEPTD